MLGACFAVLAAASTAADRGDSNEAVIALAGALVGASIAVGYDLIKSRRMDRKRDILIMQLLVQDLEDVKHLFQGVKSRAALQRQMVRPEISTDPMPRPSTELWDILRLGIPADVLGDASLMADLRLIHVGVGIVGQVLDAREDRRRNIALSGRYEHIANYDTMAEHRIDALMPIVDRATASLGAHTRHR